MKPVHPRAVQLLNDALKLELTVVNSYFVEGRMLDDQGLARLGKAFYDLSIEEMRDADELIQHILLLDGHPNVYTLAKVRVGKTPQEMLEFGLEAEREAVDSFNASAHECHELGDHATASTFEAMARDEKTHVDWFESQLAAIEAVGASAYLAQQIDPAAHPS